MNIKFPKKLEPFIREPKRFNVLEGGRGGGKSHAVAELLLIKAMESKCRILCTREIQKSIKESVHQLLSDKIKDHKYPFRILNTSIICTVTGSEFYFHGLQDKTAMNLKSFEGVDWCWIEEAQTISKKSLDVLIPTIRKSGSKLLFTMNRFEEQDPVFAMFCQNNRENVCHIYINYFDNPWLPKELKDEAEYCKALDIDDYNHIWLGLPMQQGDLNILKISQVKAAMERKVIGEGAFEIGVDVARFGDDSTVLTKRHGFHTFPQRKYKKLRTYEVSDYAVDFEGDDTSCFKVDDTGVGGGVTDDLFKKNKNVVAVNNGQCAKDKDKYPNAISEMWFEFAEIIDQIELPYDMELLKQLCGRRKKFDKQGRRMVESKDDYKTRYKKSPDDADSLLLCYYSYYMASGFLF